MHNPYEPPRAPLGPSPSETTTHDHGGSATPLDFTLRICLLCARAFPANTSCDVHPNEPLLDPRQTHALDLMDADDGALQQRIHGFWMGIGGVFGLALGVPGAILFTSLTVEAAGRIYPFLTGVVALSVGGLGAGIGANIANRRFKPRFRMWLSAAGRLPRA